MRKVSLVFFIRILVVVILTVVLFTGFRYFSKAAPVKADIVIDTRRITGIIPANWKALAQGGEESGVRMMSNVIPQIAGLFPRYIRIDHVYDFYDVVKREDGRLVFDWRRLDETVCDIYHTGAKPFLSLGYMPESLSGDKSLVSKPLNWDEWSLAVQKTIERYSGRQTRICDQVFGALLEDVYYEVWNEPDLETFGKWSLYPGQKSYLDLYRYSVIGAQNAKDVNHFLIGGPATTAAYKNWFRLFADFIIDNNLRIDFLSWHHYSKKPDDFYQDIENIDEWLSEDKYVRFRHLQKIISEWGYDSQPNPIADTNLGGAYTVASIRNLIEQQVEMGFSFEVKDGLSPSWGILTREGNKKPRYFALQMLNILDRARLDVSGEGTYIKAISSTSPGRIALIMVNYDPDGKNYELVPVTFKNIVPGTYTITETSLDGKKVETKLMIEDSVLKKSILMIPNSVVTVELVKE
ncbi:hypothetical protein GYA28_00860 [Candidatus Roizmanbacteria bacterium]|nr:hypothetical protein [Candidatus Roizmanbacteria bacterium]